MSGGGKDEERREDRDTDSGDEEEETGTTKIMKKATKDLGENLQKILKATSREVTGTKGGKSKVAFTKEEQKTVQSALDRIRSTTEKMLIEVIRLQEETIKAEERARKAEEKARKAEEEARKAEKTLKEFQMRTEREGEMEKKEKEKEKQEREEERLRKEMEEEKKAEQRRQEKERKKRQEQERKKNGTGNGKEEEWKTTSYAARLKAKIPVKEETVVKMDGKPAEEIKKTLRKNLRVQDIGGPLSQIATRKDGSLVLVSSSAENRKKLEEELKKQEGVKIQEKKKLNPTLTLTGLDAGWEREELVEEIFSENEWARESLEIGDFKKMVAVLARRKCRDLKKENVTLAVEPKLHKKITEKGRLIVGLKSCFVEELLEVKRCFNCNGFDHVAKECKAKMTCHKCGEEGHKRKECQKNVSRCGNCLRAGLKADHRFEDKKCPLLQKKLEIKIQRTARP